MFLKYPQLKPKKKKPLGRLYFIRIENNYAFMKGDTKTLKTFKSKTNSNIL